MWRCSLVSSPLSGRRDPSELAGEARRAGRPAPRPSAASCKPSSREVSNGHVVPELGDRSYRTPYWRPQKRWWRWAAHGGEEARLRPHSSEQSGRKACNSGCHIEDQMVESEKKSERGIIRKAFGIPILYPNSVFKIWNRNSLWQLLYQTKLRIVSFDHSCVQKKPLYILETAVRYTTAQSNHNNKQGNEQAGVPNETSSEFIRRKFHTVTAGLRQIVCVDHFSNQLHRVVQQLGDPNASPACALGLLEVSQQISRSQGTFGKRLLHPKNVETTWNAFLSFGRC